jgi:hypothetical protein
MSVDQFRAAVEAQVIDHGGRYWMLGVNSGAWYVHDGTDWCEADPPLAAGEPNVPPDSAHSTRLAQIDQPVSGGNTSAAAGQSNTQQKAPPTPLPHKSEGISEWVIMSIAFAIAALGFLYLAHNR